MRLADYMQANGLSDDTVAAATGRNRATVSRWRRGKLRPDWEALERIKDFTGGAVTADDWLSSQHSEQSSTPLQV